MAYKSEFGVITMKRVAKLAMKCVLVMLPAIALCIYFRTNQLRYIDDEGPYYIWNKEVSNTAQDKDYSVIVLGDSTSNAAYIPEYLSDDTINLSLGGMSPVENYYTLKDWLANHAAPKVCYISFYDGCLKTSELFWTRACYSHRYSLKDTAEIIKTAIAYNEQTIVNEHPWLSLISYALYLPNKYITPFLNAGFNQRYETNLAAKEFVDRHRGRYITVGTGEYFTTGNEYYVPFAVNPMFDHYYRKIIELCYQNQIEVHIVKLPLPDSAVFEEGYAEAFHAYYDGLCQEFPGLTVDWFPLYTKDYFADDRHMNSHGALRFSAELKALYPDDFVNDTLSAERIVAINESLCYENRLPEIMQWIKNKNYTVIISDGNGQFAEYYEADPVLARSETRLTLHKTHIDQMEEWPVYYISGMDIQQPYFSLEKSETGLTIRMDNGVMLPWDIPFDGGARLVVIDNYDGWIVCTKELQFATGTFTAA